MANVAESKPTVCGPSPMSSAEYVVRTLVSGTVACTRSPATITGRATDVRICRLLLSKARPNCVQTSPLAHRTGKWVSDNPFGKHGRLDQRVEVYACFDARLFA